MLNKNLIMLSVLGLSLAACGNKEKEKYNGYGYGTPINIPTNQNQFANFEDYAAAQLQYMYGDFTLENAVNFGNQSLAAGTHSWKTLMNKVKAAAEQCRATREDCTIDTWSWGTNYSYIDPMAETHYGELQDYLGTHTTKRVRYARYSSYGYAKNFNHTLDTVLYTLAYSYSSIYGYGFGGYGFSSGNVGGISISIGSGGLSIGAGGSFNF